MANDLCAPFVLSKMLTPKMIAQGRGRIINISSQTSGVIAVPDHDAYAAPKAGLNGLTKALMTEPAPHNSTAFVWIARQAAKSCECFIQPANIAWFPDAFFATDARFLVHLALAGNVAATCTIRIPQSHILGLIRGVEGLSFQWSPRLTRTYCSNQN